MKYEKSESDTKFEPIISWYRGEAELLKGSSVRETIMYAIRVIISELQKKEQEEFESIKNKKAY